MTDRELFIKACFAEDLQEFYKELHGSGRQQQFYNVRGLLVHKTWIPSKFCSKTNEELTDDNIDIKIGYWYPHTWKPVRKDLKLAAMKEEAYECQKIDMSCNDCIHLNRKESKCLKFDKKVIIQPNTCQPQNKECFKHRKCI